MNFEFLNDFVCFEKASQECITKYANRVPSELIDIWQRYGFGAFMGGYLKIINPDEYAQLLSSSYFRADVAVPIMATAFGDIITWEKQRFVAIVKYRYGQSEIMISGLELFIMLLKDNSFTRRFFTLELYAQAVNQYGGLAYDECFGFAPLLALGGKESVENIKKVKLKEHIALITDIAGGV